MAACAINSSADAAHRRFMHSPKGLPLIASHVSLLADLTSGLAPAVEFSLSLFGRSHGARFVYSNFSARPHILSVEELEERFGGRMMVSEHLKLNFPISPDWAGERDQRSRRIVHME